MVGAEQRLEPCSMTVWDWALIAVAIVWLGFPLARLLRAAAEMLAWIWRTNKP